MCPEILKKQVTALKASGMDIEILEFNNQCYTVVRSLNVQSPPWEKTICNIAIAIPAAYDNAALDGFYLELPYKYNNGTHPRVNGSQIRLLDRDWQLVSWHYADGKPWQSGRDSLETHIIHCRGFFFHRGAINDYR
jgi:hypothetical protein